MLKDLPCGAQLPAGDLTRGKNWYSEKLGLEPIDEDDAALHYVTGGAFFTLYLSKAAGTSGQTVMGWLTPDIEREVAELRSRGVTFEFYDVPELEMDENNIAQLGADRVAWFKDSEGNVLAIGETGRPALRAWASGSAA